MAKTSKITKKATVSSGKQKGLLRRSFNLKSRKVQFFVSVLVIAIVGAGYFTFKSFAGTVVGSWGYANIRCLTTTTTCRFATEPVAGAKNQANGMELTYTGSMQTMTSIPFLYNASYQICVTAKGNGFLRLNGPSFTAAIPSGGPVAVTNTSAYARYCLQQPIRYTVNTPAGTKMDSAITVSHIGESPVAVSLIEVLNEQGASSPTSANPISNPTSVK